ncbi:MAG: hypothetical protein ACFCGT_10030 [Sandaracinaceae bacterium]
MGRVGLLGAVQLVLAAVAAVPSVQLARIFLGRLAYPFDLEWCEGGSLVHAARLLEGQALYPGLESVFQPLPYPPVYYLAIASVGWVGRDYWAGRVVSAAGFVLMAGVLAIEVQRHARDRVSGAALAVATVGVVAVLFPVLDGWYDLARVDSLMMGLAVLGAWMVSGPRPPRGRHLWLTALVLAVSVYTKQTNALFAVWVVGFVLLRWPRPGWALAGATFLCCAIPLAALEVASGGNFSRVALTQLGSHGLDLGKLGHAQARVLAFAPFLPALPFLLLPALRLGRLHQRTVLWLGMLAVAIPAGLLPYVKWGGHWNNLMPPLVLVPPVVVLLVLDVLPRRGPGAGVGQTALLAALTAFLLTHPLAPDRYIPSDEQWARAEAFNARVAALDGGVFAPDFPFVPWRAGHRSAATFHSMAYADLEMASRDYDLDELFDRIDAEWVLMVSESGNRRDQAMRRRWRRRRMVPEDEQVPMLQGARMVIDEIRGRNERPPDGGAGGRRDAPGARGGAAGPGSPSRD